MRRRKGKCSKLASLLFVSNFELQSMWAYLFKELYMDSEVLLGAWESEVKESAHLILLET